MTSLPTAVTATSSLGNVLGTPSTNATNQVAGGQGTTKAASTPTNAGVPDPSKVAKAVDEVNKKLATASTQVVYSFDTKADRIWLNVVDKGTGKVVNELPPESVRKMVDQYATSGLSFDKYR